MRGERKDTTRLNLELQILLQLVAELQIQLLLWMLTFSAASRREQWAPQSMFLTFCGRQVVLQRSQPGWVLAHPCTTALTQPTAPFLVSPKSVMSQPWMWGLGAPHLSCNVPKDLQCDHTLLIGNHCFKWHHWQNCLLPGAPSSVLVLPDWQRDSDLFFFTESAEKKVFSKNF